MALDQLEQLHARFLDRVSHELRTPVTVVSGFARTMLEHDHDLPAAQRRRFLERLVGASERLESMVDQVLTLTSIEAGLRETNTQPCDVASLVRREARAFGTAIAVDLPDDTSLVVATDGTLVGLALRSLYANTRAFAGGGRVRAWREPTHVVVEVVDEGPQGANDVASPVFERVGPGDGEPGGLGLGLPMARRLLAMVDASLDHRQVGRGAAFTVRLPAGDPPAA